MKLIIPANIPLGWELIRGLGKQEIRQCLMVLLPALAVDILISKVWTAPIAPLVLMMTYILLVSFCYLFFAKLDQYQSAYLFLCRIMQFRREQQCYYYQRRKEVLVYEEAGPEAAPGAGVFEH